jgi:hypothetical protein
MAASTSGGALLLTAGDDLTIPAGVTVDASGALHLVSDDASPATPAAGTGGISVGANAALSGAGAIRLYAATRADNSIAGTATFNGSAFTAGTMFVATDREQWGVYSPDGTATAPFTFFYKDPAPPAADPGPVTPAPTAPSVPEAPVPPPAPVAGRLVALRPAASSGPVALPFRVSGPGVLEVLVVHGRAGRLAPRTIDVPPGFVALARASVTTTGEGVVEIPFRLSKRARALLRRNRGRLGVAVVAVFTPAGGTPRWVTGFYTFRQTARGGRLRLTGLRPAA